jgi:protein gp37
MAENSKIEWCDHTFNPFIGCTKVSPGCDNCYAEQLMDKRMHKVQWGAGKPRVRTSAANWREPQKWNAAHAEFFAKHGRRQRVFCASLADVFDNEVPRQWRQDLFDLILATPNLDWLLLTKRIGNAAKMLQGVAECRGTMMDANDRYVPLPNVWIGATIVNQEEADRDVPKLLETPAAVRFLSMEPLLGPVDLCSVPLPDGDMLGLALDSQGAQAGIDWVIVGGESGLGARPMSVRWARALRDQCAAAGVPFLFKQWGEWAPAWPRPSETPGRFAFGDYEHEPGRFIQTEYYPRQFTSFGARCILERVGKKAAGRQLDGCTHDEFPGMPR